VEDKIMKKETKIRMSLRNDDSRKIAALSVASDKHDKGASHVNNDNFGGFNRGVKSDKKSQKRGDNRKESTSKFAMFDKVIKNMSHNLPYLLTEYLEGVKIFTAKIISNQNFELKLDVGFSQNTLIYFGQQLYLRFRECNSVGSGAYRVIDQQEEKAEEREERLFKRIVDTILFIVIYTLYYYEEVHGSNFSSKCKQDLDYIRVPVGLITLIRITDSMNHFFELGVFGSLNIKLRLNCLDNLKHYGEKYDDKGKLIQESFYQIIKNGHLKNDPKCNRMLSVFRASMDALANSVGFNIYRVTDDLIQDTSIGLIGEVISFHNAKNNKFSLVSFVPDGSDYIRAAFSTCFDVRLEGSPTLHKSDRLSLYKSIVSDSSVAEESHANSASDGTQLEDIQESSSIDIGTDLINNLGFRFPNPDFYSIAPFEIIYFFGIPFENATNRSVVTGGDAHTFEADTDGINPSGPISSFRIGFNDKVNEIKEGFKDMVSQTGERLGSTAVDTAANYALMIAAGFLPGGRIIAPGLSSVVQGSNLTRPKGIGGAPFIRRNK
jgi:hypothetical protein